MQLAQALLTRSRPDWLEALLLDRKVKVHVYHCSGRAARLGDVTDAADAEQRAALLRAIDELRPEGESSQLGTAVRQVLNDFRGSSLAAVVMLTDGVTTEGRGPAQGGPLRPPGRRATLLRRPRRRPRGPRPATARPPGRGTASTSTTASCSRPA